MHGSIAPGIEVTLSLLGDSRYTSSEDVEEFGNRVFRAAARRLRADFSSSKVYSRISTLA